MSVVLNANQQEQENSLILKPTPRSYLLDGACDLTVQLQQLHGWLLPILADTVLPAPTISLALAVFCLFSSLNSFNRGSDSLALRQE